MKYSESISIEIKREYTDDIRKTVISFANTIGGTIYIGIEDDGTVIGIKDLDVDLLKVTNVIRDSIRPDVTMFVRCGEERIDEKTVIAIHVQRGSACPYYLASKGLLPEGVFVRHGASTVPATESAILKMIKETDDSDFESTASIRQDLTFETAQKIFDEAGLKFGKPQKRTLGLLGSDGSYNNLALLLSDQCVHSIKIAVFQGTFKSIFKDRREFSGSLFRQMSDAYEMIDRNNRIHVEVKGLKRIDTRDYPEDAIREILLNALIHRDYTFSASTLISIFDDRIEFASIGGLVRSIVIDDIMIGISFPRNKKLAEVFYRLKWIEAYGSGIPMIFRNYDEYDMKPEITVTENVFKITLPNINENHAGLSVKEYGTEHERRVMELFRKQSHIIRKDVETHLSISQPMAVRILKKMVEENMIRRIGGSRNIKYYKS